MAYSFRFDGFSKLSHRQAPSDTPSTGNPITDCVLTLPPIREYSTVIRIRWIAARQRLRHTSYREEYRNQESRTHATETLEWIVDGPAQLGLIHIIDSKFSYISFNSMNRISYSIRTLTTLKLTAVHASGYCTKSNHEKRHMV